MAESAAELLTKMRLPRHVAHPHEPGALSLTAAQSEALIALCEALDELDLCDVQRILEEEQYVSTSIDACSAVKHLAAFSASLVKP